MPGTLSYLPKANFAKEWDKTDGVLEKSANIAQGTLNILGSIFNTVVDASIYLGSLVPAVTGNMQDIFTDKEDITIIDREVDNAFLSNNKTNSL